jgi:hypothetical protein
VVVRLSEWIPNANFEIVANQKRGQTLIFNGYTYKREACFKNTTNWICSVANGKVASPDKCKARCITKTDGSLKLGRHYHNHDPTKPEKISAVVVSCTNL